MQVLFRAISQMQRSGNPFPASADSIPARRPAVLMVIRGQRACYQPLIQNKDLARVPCCHHSRSPGHSHAASRLPTGCRQDHHLGAGSLRHRLRHLHTALPRRPRGHRAAPQALCHRPRCRPHRRDLADGDGQQLLAQRAGAQQRHLRGGPGAVGHQGQAGGDAGVPAAGRQVSGGRRLLCARRRQLPRGGGGQHPRLHGGGISPYQGTVGRIRRSFVGADETGRRSGRGVFRSQGVRAGSPPAL